MKLDFFEIDVTMFLGVRNFGNTSAVRVILFFKNVENLNEISRMKQKIEKKLFLFEIIASELVPLNCLY